MGFFASTTESSRGEGGSEAALPGKRSSSASTLLLSGNSNRVFSHGSRKATENGGHPQRQPPPQQPRRSRVFLPRMVDRDLPFFQSRNTMNVRNVDLDNRLWPLRRIDWFHTLLRLPAWASIGLLLGLWMAVVGGVFGTLYWYEDNYHYRILDCGLGTSKNTSISYPGALAFSLETCTTVGYGLPGSSTSFFERKCSAVQATIFAEMVWSMLFNAFLFAFFYSIVSKSEFRSSQIVFTNKLMVNVETTAAHGDGNGSGGKNRAYVRLQCYDIDSKHPLVEAHARMYFLDHKLKMHPLRLMDPNDDLGAHLYPSVPADVVHHIDHHSALCPPGFRCPHVQSGKGLALRSLDSHTGGRDELACPVCGESYGTYERLRTHVAYAAMVEARENYPLEGSHRGLDLPANDPMDEMTLGDLRDHIERTFSEIVVVVEAIDPQLSGTFQSLQSYRYEDLVFGECLEACVSTLHDEGEGQRVFAVDVNRFHATTHSQPDARGGCPRHEASLASSRPGWATPARIESFVSDVTEDGGQAERALSDRSSLLAPTGRNNNNNYLGRSYDTFASFRAMVRGATGGRHRGSARDGAAEAEGTAVNDRMPSYASAV